ncbi:MAG: DUF354 domain-containing protein [Verrucomicrobia bacterium]|nr:DUF354 domain-containing protein [Verrucomicrobiota bacterium]
MRFDGESTSPLNYPVENYVRFLEYIRSRYANQYWHALPREVADFVSESRKKNGPAALRNPARSARAHKVRPKIWIDLDNTPHVPFFEPIMDELKARGFPLLVTARDAFQVCELADQKGMRYIKIGKHHGKHRLLKATGLLLRAFQLFSVVAREKPALGVSHGARSQLLLGTWLRIPTVLVEDYEYCQFPIMMRPSWLVAPTVIPNSVLPVKNGRVRKYSGIKEDVYAWKLRPDPGVLRNLGLSEADIVATVRPPATEAHYHNPESEQLFEQFMERACQTPGVRIVLLPRNQKQGDWIRNRWPAWFTNGKTVIPDGVVDGLNLIWHSDFVVSGGGTMNREAAALHVPVYSIFRGIIGAVDEHLRATGRLVLIESAEDVKRKINVVPRPRSAISEVTSKNTLNQIVDTIEEIADACGR